MARTRLIENEGFNSLEYFGVMDRDTKVLETAKNLATRVVTTCLNPGKFQIKMFQDLVWWIHDLQKHNQPLIAADFDQGAKRAVMTGKRIKKDRTETDATVSGIGKFKVEEFEANEYGFRKLLSRNNGTYKAELRYLIRDRVVPEVFKDVATKQMHHIRLSGESFGDENQKVFQILKEYLTNSPGWTWIERFNATENGH